jgi:hypothetical protein
MVMNARKFYKDSVRITFDKDYILKYRMKQEPMIFATIHIDVFNEMKSLIFEREVPEEHHDFIYWIIWRLDSVLVGQYDNLIKGLLEADHQRDKITTFARKWQKNDIKSLSIFAKPQDGKGERVTITESETIEEIINSFAKQSFRLKRGEGGAPPDEKRRSDLEKFQVKEIIQDLCNNFEVMKIKSKHRKAILLRIISSTIKPKHKPKDYTGTQNQYEKDLLKPYKDCLS